MSRVCPVIIMAKAPIPGFAKTRLAPALGAEGAAKLGERLLQHAVAQACAADLGPVEVCCTPDSRHPAFVALARDGRVSLSRQRAGDLGLRMAHALERTLGAYGCAVLIGADSPAMDAAYLRQAAETLHDHDAVFGPALDGGYILVGMRRLIPAVFEGIDWSTPQVMAQTRQRLHSAGALHRELALLSDVDEPEDLARLPAEWLV